MGCLRLWSKARGQKALSLQRSPKLHIYIYIYTREPSCYARRRSPSCIAQPYKAKVLRFITFSLVHSETSNMRGHAASEVPAISKQPPSEFQELSTVSSRIVLPHLMSSLVGPVTVTRFFSIAGNIRMIFSIVGTISSAIDHGTLRDDLMRLNCNSPEWCPPSRNSPAVRTQS